MRELKTPKKELLLVEDDRIICLLQQKMLESQGVSIPLSTFDNGQEALDYIRGQHENQEFLILLDINMPVMNGWEFLKALKLQPNQERFFVAMVTSSINQKDRDMASKFPQVFEFYEKPLVGEKMKMLMKRKEVRRFFDG